jgi:uncharacterized Fe-S radical SAM superfamily protein PflX
MPGGVADLREVVALVESIDPALPLHVLTSYRPQSDALKRADLNRTGSEDEIKAAREVMGASRLTTWFVGL